MSLLLALRGRTARFAHKNPIVLTTPQYSKAQLRRPSQYASLITTYSTRTGPNAAFDCGVQVYSGVAEQSKPIWTKDIGAFILPNIGDTDRRCSKAAQNPETSIEELGRCHDASDDIQRAPQYMTPLRTNPIPDIPDHATATISVPDTNQRQFVRMFRKVWDEWAFVSDSHIFLAADIRAGLELGIDARETRRPGIWDGRVTICFQVKHGDEIVTDEIKLRVAPVLVHNHLDVVEEVVSTAGDEASFPWQHRFNHDLTEALSGTGVSGPLLLDKDNDHWAQDIVKPGYVSMPGPNGTTSLRVHIRSSQDSRVSGRQVFTSLRGTGVGAVHYLGGARDEINSMGNLDCTPPFTHKGTTWPAGRIIMGHHGPYEPHILPYFRAQEAQDPILLDAAWLWVGHVDEFVQFLPVKSERGWAVVIVDPMAGLAILQDAQNAGHGSIPMFSRKTDAPLDGVTPETCTEDTYGCLSIPVPGTSINEYLADPNVRITNMQVSKRIAANIEILKTEIGLSDNEIYHLPTLFNNVNRNDLPFIGPRAPDENLAVVATYPATINGVVLTGFATYIAPRPWGPVIDGNDVVAEATRKLYEGLGWKVKFIDNWNSHHGWGGEVHCATNTMRDMRRRWWS
ncbi:arginine deiminase type-3 [Paraphoma chrysanthemicola]|nr:arginine deiminase type-3 [Paraphoma chrysanthemicola]